MLTNNLDFFSGDGDAGVSGDGEGRGEEEGRGFWTEHQGVFIGFVKGEYEEIKISCFFLKFGDGFVGTGGYLKKKLKVGVEVREWNLSATPLCLFFDNLLLFV